MLVREGTIFVQVKADVASADVSQLLKSSFSFLPKAKVLGDAVTWRLQGVLESDVIDAQDTLDPTRCSQHRTSAQLEVDHPVSLIRQGLELAYGRLVGLDCQKAGAVFFRGAVVSNGLKYHFSVLSKAGSIGFDKFQAGNPGTQIDERVGASLVKVSGKLPEHYGNRRLIEAPCTDNARVSSHTGT